MNPFDRPLEPVERTLAVFDVDRPTLVLGSTQGHGIADLAACEAAGVGVVRRRSGGGAVLLDPGGTLWVDVDLPRTDHRWDDDVGRAAWWLGEAWATALGGDAVVHRGRLELGRWGRLVCFAGLGPGEVTVGGRKVVGISQRRTRAGARFQCAVPLRWEPERLAGLLALGDDDRRRLAADLADAVAPIDPASAPALVEALIGAIADVEAEVARNGSPEPQR